MVQCGAVRCGAVRFEPHGFGALDVGAGEALSEAADFIGAPLDPDRGGIGVVDESSVGLFLASDGVQNSVGDERGRMVKHGGMIELGQVGDHGGARKGA